MVRSRGYSLLELVVTLAVFGVFIIVVVTLTAEMRQQEKFYPVNFIAHPEVNAVLARLRRDINDTTAYYGEFAKIPAAVPDVLWIDTITNAGTSEVVMWDFRTPGEVHRRTYNSASQQVAEWVARGVPLFTYSTFKGPHNSDGVRLQGFDTSGKKAQLVIDAKYIPRPHP
jgi:prepilin-type N-terminal cleavage/methylation domain-containing protein